MLVPHRSAALVLAAVSIAALLAGCGSGGGGGDTIPAAEVATKVEAACRKVNGVNVWLPEHLQKTHESSHEGEAIVDEAAADFSSTLESLDPPDDLRRPLEALKEGLPAASTHSRAALKAALRKRIALYREVGATRCGTELQASILVIDGSSIEAAYEKVGVPLPPHPAGW